MKVDIDLSELSALAKELAESDKEATRAVHGVTVTEGKAVQDRAKAAAPRDRPWLATQGIRRKTWRNPDGSTAAIYTVPDPRGRPSGFFVEYGTSVMPPQPFMLPALVPAESTYPDAILKAIDPLGGGGGSATGSDDA